MATKPIINLQENFLNQARKENVPVTVHLLNGFQIKGMIRGFDQFTVVVDAMGRQQMIFKHAISTITPVKPLGTQAVEKSAESEDSKTEAATTEEQPAEQSATE
ncbi:MAG: RNA chaperone Hfq [Selenomonadaceae bacterium]|nr:RNA chaperone Hfq [Selenomonadaceae bacterium]